MKIHDTRKQAAVELMQLLTEGPSFSDTFFVGEKFSQKEATDQFQLWSNTWVIPLVKRLVPEFRKKGCA